MEPELEPLVLMPELDPIPELPMPDPEPELPEPVWSTALSDAPPSPLPTPMGASPEHAATRSPKDKYQDLCIDRPPARR
jgi:hypothetical protein